MVGNVYLITEASNEKMSLVKLHEIDNFSLLHTDSFCIFR